MNEWVNHTTLVDTSSVVVSSQPLIHDELPCGRPLFGQPTQSLPQELKEELLVITIELSLATRDGLLWDFGETFPVTCKMLGGRSYRSYRMNNAYRSHPRT